MTNPTSLSQTQLDFEPKQFESKSALDNQTHNMMNKPASLSQIQLSIVKTDEIKCKILEERKYVDIKPYSHNLISLYLKQYAELEGHDKTNQLIIDLKLDELGWCPVKEKLGICGCV